jgi:hypothetical protein
MQVLFYIIDKNRGDVFIIPNVLYVYLMKFLIL